ncbi:xyloglucan endotransglucosylase/hydrolase protein 22-like [Sesamum indicum]|uniref:Xyloglucan endotransglucosylase/hydrolase n=1 Tax=Sesamum indicum TaxID=4182 RepID=A0A8M8UT85_SESIN|nr:xyloglucan endotransglucosylase/hydrolase protein 22-like [Sesamum indicum]
MPPRSSHQPRAGTYIPYMAFIIFSAIFVFRLDVFVTQTISTARRNQELKYEITTQEPSPPTVIKNENATFYKHVLVTWGEFHTEILNDGELLKLTLDKHSGSGFQSRKQLLFGKIDMQIKLIPGDSAGTVTTYYFSSLGDHHDEIDFEFLGNSTGNPYTLHTNVFSQGKGDREQQFFLCFYVDNIPIREFKNLERIGVPYPKDQAMRVHSSLWNADDWATQHGLVKTNWTLAPFNAWYRNFSMDGCIWSPETRASACADADFSTRHVLKMELDRRSRARMKRLQKKHMVYDYCKDKWRFPKGPGRECRMN